MTVDPSNIKRNRFPPLVVIEELKVDGARFKIYSSGLSSNNQTPVVIPPGKKRLEFSYTALSFLKVQNIRFKLKLEGYDQDWIDGGNWRTTSYTSLSPGDYTFKVVACNSDGLWNQAGASLSFSLEPYFYQTTLFYVTVTLFVIFSIIGGYRLRVRQLVTREKELSILVAQ
ncbi:MAG: hypothetical protein GY940_45445, partial [bacterium]|nr:hypothetical protein [bacterium]